MSSLKSLFEEGLELSGKGTKMVLSILFLDLRQFTTYVEHKTLEDTYGFLNGLFSRLVPYITSNEGVVDKFMGDSIMALFDGEHSADRSVTAAIAMQKELMLYNQERKSRTEKEVFAGIGINTGPVMVGGLGSSKHLALTVVGDDVNLAARVENLTKRFQAKILITHRTHTTLEHQRYLLREVDTMRVRGRSQLVNIYEVFDSDSPQLKQLKRQTGELLFQGISLYKAGFFEEALESLKQMLAVSPRDEVAIRYIKRCRYFLKNPPPLAVSLEKMMSDVEENLGHTLTERASRYKMDAQGFLELSIRGAESKFKNGKIPVTLLDLSASGMRLNAPQDLQQENTYDLHFRFSHEEWHKVFDGGLTAFSQIVWSKQKIDADSPIWEAGVEFIFMEPEHEKSLQDGLKQLETKN